MQDVIRVQPFTDTTSTL